MPNLEPLDALIVGAGPTGLACGIELKRRGLNSVLIEKGCIVNSIYHYPTHMVFFTTPELLEIGGIPMTSLNEKPGRTEALKYYRRVAEYFKLNVHQYEQVVKIAGQDDDFIVTTTKDVYHARKIILATGYYDLPNLLDVPGEDLPKVIHYYKEPHPYYDHDVVVIGANRYRRPYVAEYAESGIVVTYCAGTKLRENVGPTRRFHRLDALSPTPGAMVQYQLPASPRPPATNPSSVTGSRPSLVSANCTLFTAGRMAIGPPRVSRSSNARNWRLTLRLKSQ